MFIKQLCILLLCTSLMLTGFAQQIKLNFTGNLADSSVNHYVLDTNNCGSSLNFCDDPAGQPNAAYQFDGTCTMKTDSFSMTSTAYPGMSLSFYMSKNFDSDTIAYGLLHFYKGPFLVYAQHDSLFITITDSMNNDHTFGAPCVYPNDQWFCVVISFRDYGNVDFYFDKVKHTAGTTNFKVLRKTCEPGFCYWFSASFALWNYQPFKGKFDEILAWNWPSDSVNVDEICTKAIIPLGLQAWDTPALRAFPNPVGNDLVLETEQDGAWSLFDFSGRTVMRKMLSAGRHTISVSDLPSGLYQGMLWSPMGYKTIRIMKE
jgi:hypothetical protein